MGLHTSDAFRQHPDGNNDKIDPSAAALLLCNNSLGLSDLGPRPEIGLIAADRLRRHRSPTRIGL